MLGHQIKKYQMGQRLVISSSSTAHWFGLIFIFAGFIAINSVYAKFLQNGSVFGLVFWSIASSFFVIFGLIAAIPTTREFVIDRENDVFIFSLILFSKFTLKKKFTKFSLLQSVGIEESRNESIAYFPFFRFNDGSKINISSSSDGTEFVKYNSIVAQIAAELSLPRVDVKS